MADIGWRRRRGSSPAAPTGARQRAGLTPLPPPTHFHASGRRFTHNSSGQSKNPLTAITVSTAIIWGIVPLDVEIGEAALLALSR